MVVTTNDANRQSFLNIIRHQQIRGYPPSYSARSVSKASVLASQIVRVRTETEQPRPPAEPGQAPPPAKSIPLTRLILK